MSYQVECPNNTYMCYKNLVDIMKKINKQQESLDTGKCSNYFNLPELNKDGTIDTCRKVPNSDGKSITNCNNCDYLFENLIKGNTTCKELFDGLNSMNVDELKEQIKYNLFQLVHMKAKAQPMRVFGTIDWWKQNIWGINKIQNYIYIVSFTVALMMIGYFLYEFVINEIQDSGMIWVGFTFIVAIIICVLIMVYTLKPLEYKPPVFDRRVSETNKKEYSKKVQESWGGETKGGLQISWALPIIFGVFYIFLIVHKLTMPNSALGLRNFALYSLAGLIIALNMFYTFLIPQFIIVGVVLQKILMGETPLMLKAIILISIFILSSVQYSREHSGLIDKGVCTQEENPNIGWQYWFIFTILTLMTIGNEIIGVNDKIPFTGFSKGWGLFMEPYFTFVK